MCQLRLCILINDCIICLIRSCTGSINNNIPGIPVGNLLFVNILYHVFSLQLLCRYLQQIIVNLNVNTDTSNNK